MRDSAILQEIAPEEFIKFEGVQLVWLDVEVGEVPIKDEGVIEGDLGLDPCHPALKGECEE